MSIASVEHAEFGNIMELSVTGHVLIWAKKLKSLKWSIAEQNRWMEPEESKPLDSCQEPA